MSSEIQPIIVCKLEPHDLTAALNIQAETYPPFLLEEEAVFLSRIDLNSSYCLAAKRGDELLGYLLAHGWRRQSPPPLRTPLAEAEHSEVLFLHDLAVSAVARSLGVGRRLITRALALAAQNGLSNAELIAVEGAADYWRRFGFVEGTVSENLREKLGTYGTHACWMTREIP